MDIQVIINQLMILFLVILVGFILFKVKIMTVEFNKLLTRLLLDITLPAMILASVMEQTQRPEMKTVLTVLAIAFALYFVVLPLISVVLVKVLRIPKAEQGLYIFMNIFSNIGFMGFPMIDAIYGSDAVFYAAIFNLIFNLCIYMLGVPIMRYGTGQKTEFNAKSLLTPGIILSLTAIVIYFFNIPCHKVLADAVDMIGSITSPVAMLLIGATLARMDINAVFTEWRIYPFSLIKQILIPLLLWFPLKWLVHDELILGISLIMISMPIANTAVLFATEYDGNEMLAAKTVFITTVMSIGTIPLVIGLCM